MKNIFVLLIIPFLPLLMVSAVQGSSDLQINVYQDVKLEQTGIIACDSCDFVIEIVEPQPPYKTTLEKMKIRICNDTEQDAIAGYHYTMEKLIEGKWELLPLNYTFADLGIALLKGGSCLIDITIQHNVYDFTPGLYRLISNVSVGVYENVYPAIEFRLE